MAETPLRRTLRCLAATGGESDLELLGRWAERRDEEAVAGGWSPGIDATP